MQKRENHALLLLLLLLLLVAFFAHAARPEPAEHTAARAPEGSEVAVESCGDECMMRRTLEAHVDYIYTQDNNP
ncbi:unnamed protein product [Spirodela intermedia]|uniref:Phytosulfokine n=1 Tax=Spirodela intermedia TaxID=51605 RepID=A0A7I8IJZ1_SPIIN|nr:unnamed protein product [Spirodela intermedia]CAA6657690.1 unnamed protein product [Spirodela intermedia]